MRNAYQVLKRLLPEPALYVGEIVAISNGVATIELPGGGTMQARGAGTVGQNVYFRDGAIEGVAPSLPLEVIEV